MGFGQGAEGTNGNGFQLLMIIFIELFGVTLGQAIGALSPSIRVGFYIYSHCHLKLIDQLKIAALVNPFLILVLTTYAGVYPGYALYF